MEQLYQSKAVLVIGNDPSNQNIRSWGWQNSRRGFVNNACESSS